MPYLAGNQLVGVSTIEGYIRALLSLLHSCRSVERKRIIRLIFLLVLYTIPLVDIHD